MKSFIMFTVGFFSGALFNSHIGLVNERRDPGFASRTAQEIIDESDNQ